MSCLLLTLLVENKNLDPSRKPQVSTSLKFEDLWTHIWSRYLFGEFPCTKLLSSGIPKVKSTTTTTISVWITEPLNTEHLWTSILLSTYLQLFPLMVWLTPPNLVSNDPPASDLGVWKGCVPHYHHPEKPRTLEPWTLSLDIQNTDPKKSYPKHLTRWHLDDQDVSGVDNSSWWM